MSRDTGRPAARLPGPAHQGALEGGPFVENFGLGGARLLLAVGSHILGVADDDSDTDFLAVYSGETAPPMTIPLPGAVALSSTLSTSWIGQFFGREVNVEVVWEPRLNELGALMSPAVSLTRAPILQMLDARVLDRVRTGIAVPIGDRPADLGYLAELRQRLYVARLPALLLVMSLGSALAYLEKAERRPADRRVVRFALDAVADGATVATLCLCDTVAYSMKKAARLLIAAQAEHADLPFTVDDLDSLWFGSDDAIRLRDGRQALHRIRSRVHELAVRGDPLWAEAERRLAAYAEPDRYADHE